MLYLTTEAANKTQEMMEKHDLDPSSAGIRLSVKSGGCSGFQYKLDLEEKPASQDRIFETESGIRIFCDPKSYLYMKGTTIGYTQGMTGSGFSFNNPKAKRQCGCGTSFAV